MIAIVPAHNEEGAIGDVVDEIRAFDPSFDVVVIDDGSTDATAAVASAHGATVVVLPFNLGIGGAVQTGFKYALEHDYELAVRLDGDGQHDPAGADEAAGADSGRRGGHRDGLALRARRWRATGPRSRDGSESRGSHASSRC